MTQRYINVIPQNLDRAMAEELTDTTGCEVSVVAHIPLPKDTNTPWSITKLLIPSDDRPYGAIFMWTGREGVKYAAYGFQPGPQWKGRPGFSPKPTTLPFNWMSIHEAILKWGKQ